jgi:hypothetical protein
MGHSACSASDIVAKSDEHGEISTKVRRLLSRHAFNLSAFLSNYARVCWLGMCICDSRGFTSMKLIETKITITKSGYVKNEDELCDLCDKAEAIVEKWLDGMKAELDQAGFVVVSE